jgi:hypothetical protein
MRLADYIDIQRNCALKCGLDPDLLNATEFAQLRDLISARIKRAYRQERWPDLNRVEKRYFRDLWDSGTSYTASTATSAVEVYYAASGLYYQCLAANTNQAPATLSGSEYETNTTYWAESSTSYSADNYDASTAYSRGDSVYYPTTDRYYQLHAASSTGNVPTDTTKWGVLTDFDRYIAFAQTGKTAIGDALHVYNLNPRTSNRAQELSSSLSENGVQVHSAVSSCWLEYRLRYPVLLGGTFSTTATYAVGDQVYFSSATTKGNFYDCATATSAGESPDSAAAKWTKVQLPLDMAAYLYTGATRELAIAETLLGDDQMHLVGQQGQTQPARVLTR